MKVTVTRSGGFAGLSTRWEVRVDEQPDEDSWLLLLRDLPWDAQRQVPPQPDRYIYRIRCEPVPAARPEPREAVIPEQSLTGGWRELVDRVRHLDTTPERPTPSSRTRKRGSTGF
ncbi:protealysin inhibitor emfourin [Mycetocola zhadangensis]|uniref:Uncharacterized protein n=1 Tax=Mycetocola zhadangensis TaxID=1164595 RepID=A0A3L7IT41_9MICO|nr:protealysin inhibitor emfourin [Mycetocola zhadangensis]RLQ81335.1 hypothetical protein D9V28_13290 [Mycetocola zhadangensis]GGF02607.1 hypothetical protein GCM10011313_27160 [Mycetocola zhadangensis]